MSIVGTQSVSMRDLMKLGPEALGAMAQGQTKSIAPSYMVIAALKALTDQQKGMQSQVPGQTIKDQVVAQSVPPQQAGIGAVRGFNSGGLVGTAAINAKIADFFRRQFGPAWADFKEETRRGLAGRRQTEEEINYGHEGNRMVTQATTPTERVGTEKGRATNLGNAEYTPPKAQQPGGSAEVASATSRSGIGDSKSLLEKYKSNTVKANPLAEINDLVIPEDKFLNDAIAKYGSPDEKRMAELKAAERNAGLGAFAKSILKGRGFGGAFGPAVADSFEAQDKRGKERRDYEDARERTALELGLKKGSREYENFFKNIDYKKGERSADLDAQKDSRDFGFKITQAKNEEALKQEQLAIQREANAIQMSIRKDGMDRIKFEKLLALQQGATKVAQEYVDEYVKANPTLMGQTNNPDVQRKLRDMRNSEYRRLFPQELERIMHQGLGMTGAQPTAGGKVYRGEMK